MSYEQLTEKVRQAEQALEARERTVAASWRVTKDTWKEAWTPGRIAAVGVIAGFMYGRRRARPGGGGEGLIRTVSSLIALASSMQAKSAAHEAEDVAQTAEHTVATSNAAAGRPGPQAEPAQHWSNPPTAAAAATELSEP